MFEICIVGAGPVGLVFANCLAKSEYIRSIALLALTPIINTSQQKHHDLRAYAITKNNLDLLNRLNVLEKIPRKGQISKIDVISKQSQTGIFWGNATASVIENNLLMQALWSPLRQNNKITLINKKFGSDQTINYQRNNFKLFLPVQGGLQCKLLVGCDGYNSNVRKWSRINSNGWKYNQKSIVFNAQLNNISDQQTAIQIHYEGNVLALLPLSDKIFNIIWSVDNLDHEYLINLKKQDLIKIANNILSKGQRYSKSFQSFPKIEEIINQEVQSFPLAYEQAQQFINQRVVLIGDAAHRYHPMVGMGVNTGMRDAVLLANNIIKNKKTGNDIGNKMALSNFEAQSQKFHIVQKLGIEGIKKIFEIDQKISNNVRKIGLNVLQKNATVLNGFKSLAQENPLSDVSVYQWQEN